MFLSSDYHGYDHFHTVIIITIMKNFAKLFNGIINDGFLKIKHNF